MLLCALAMLASQAAAFAAPVLWTLCAIITVLRRRKLRIARGVLSATAITLGLAAGAAVSMYCGHVWSHQRIALATDGRETLAYGLKLVGFVVLGREGFYPLGLQIIHVAILSIGVLGLIIHFARRHDQKPVRIFLAAVLAAGLVFLPYTGPMAAREHWPAWRVMYVGPMLISGAWLIALATLRARWFMTPVLIILMGLATAFYIPIARTESAAWVHVFQRDRKVLREIEAIAAEHHGTRVVVTTTPGWRRDPNPYRLPYAHAESRISAFQLAWTWAGFVHRFSKLEPATDAASSLLAAETCAPCRDQPGFQFRVDEQAGIVVVCPP